MRIPFWASLAMLGIAFPVLAQEDDKDLGSPFRSEEDSTVFRPPAGWSAHQGVPPEIVRFAAPEKGPAAELIFIHYFPQNPTPLAHFRVQLEKHLKTKYPDHTPILNRQVAVAGLPAFQVALRTKTKNQDPPEEIVIYRTIVHRSNLEYYAFDCQCIASAYDRLAPLFDKSIATLKIEKTEPTLEERAATARAVEFLRGGALGKKELEGEGWQGIYLTKKKVGYQRQKLAPVKVEGAAGYEYESDTILDFQEGGKCRTVVRGSFTADGKFQRISSEEIVAPEKEPELKYRFTATLRGGRVTVQREMKEIREEASFDVPDGTLFTDVADVFRRAASTGPKSTYLVPILNPFRGDPGGESLEVAGKESVEVEVDVMKEVFVVLSNVDRRRSLVYWYDAKSELFSVQGARQAFVIVAMSKEEALKP